MAERIEDDGDEPCDCCGTPKDVTITITGVMSVDAFAAAYLFGNAFSLNGGLHDPTMVVYDRDYWRRVADSN